MGERKHQHTVSEIMNKVETEENKESETFYCEGCKNFSISREGVWVKCLYCGNVITKIEEIIEKTIEETLSSSEATNSENINRGLTYLEKARVALPYIIMGTLLLMTMFGMIMTRRTF